MKERLSFIVLVACLTVPFGRGAGGDWPQWRGANRDGVSLETGLLKEWPADGPTRVWKAAGLGKGFGSVSTLGGRLYLRDQDVLLCYDVRGTEPR
ncbi:MAG TPA: hypothetical protein PKM73_05400 [Verrucomicrobiota bacterium]|nr:hypothetical protein [Verrucomicrobiota bacterium]HNU51316.1 hypothetical protein [Verrucomicrobiota bacterium]